MFATDRKTGGRALGTAVHLPGVFSTTSRTGVVQNEKQVRLSLRDDTVRFLNICSNWASIIGKPRGIIL